MVITDNAPGPWRITFDTNPDDCNFRCQMCEEHSSYNVDRRKGEKGKRRMPFFLIEKVVAEAAPLGLSEIIPSTMGEPLLYDDFERILELCRQYCIKLNLTTNGSFPYHRGKGGVEYWAERIVPVTSDVKFSWNGARPETHERIMVGSRWKKSLHNLQHFISVRDTHAEQGESYCRVTLQLTFMESNLAELPDIVRLAIQLGVDRVKGHHLWTHFPEIKALSLRRDQDSISRWNRAVEKMRKVANDNQLPNGKTVLLENIHPLIPDATVDLAPGGRCPFLGKEAWVDTTGRFSPCCAPDAQRRALGEFGNLNDVGLTTIWQGDAYRSLLGNYQDHSLCRTCNMRKPREAE